MICSRIEMFDIMADQTCLVEYDLDTRTITWTSKSLDQLFGYSLHGELEGHPIEVLVPEARREQHRAHVDAYAPHPTARVVGRNMLVQGQRKDGTVFPAIVRLMPGVAGPQSSRHRVVVGVVIDMSGVLPNEPAEAAKTGPMIRAMSETEPKTVSEALKSVSTMLLFLSAAALLASLFLFWRALAGGFHMSAQESLLAAITSMREREYERAAELYTQAADGGADPILSMGGGAECLFYLGKYDEALALCDRLNRTVPNAGRAHYLRGLVWYKQGKVDAAMDQFRTAARHGDSIALTMLRKRG